MQETREAATLHVFYLDETWVNQSHARSMCWKISDESGELKISGCKDIQLIVLHAGSVNTGFILQSKLVLSRSKSNSLDDYHSEMTYSVYNSVL